MKKMFKCLFAIILSLIVVDNARAEDAFLGDNPSACGNSICYYGTSGGKTGYWRYAGEDNSVVWWDYNGVAYRVTFFDSSGNQLGESVDYYSRDFNDYPTLTTIKTNINYYTKAKLSYKNSKFSLNGSSDIKPNYDLSVPSSYSSAASTWKSKIGGSQSAPNDFTKTLINNATDSSMSYNTFIQNYYLKGNLWATIEPLFEFKAVRLEKEKDYEQTEEVQRILVGACEAGCDDTGKGKACKTDCRVRYAHYTIYKPEMENVTYYKGTATEMALALNALYATGTYGTGLNGVGFVRCGSTCETFIKFHESMSVSSSEIPAVSKLGITSMTQSWENLAKWNSNWGLNVFKVSPNNTTVEEECTFENHSELNRDWNPNANNGKGACCPEGQEYNNEIKKCEPPKNDDPGIGVWKYFYECNSSLNVCGDDDVNHQLLSFSGGMTRKKPSGNISAGAACVLYNPRYATSNGNIYCAETLYTDLQSLVSNLEKVTSGRFIPINANPSITITGDCYSNANIITTDELEAFVKSYYSNLSTGVNLKYFDNNEAKYKSGRGTITIISSGSDITDYNLKYNHINFNVEYNYDPETVINPYVNKLDAQGTDTEISNKSNKNASNINFKTSALKAAGKYSGAIGVSLTGSVTNLNLFNKLLTSGSPNEIKKSVNLTNSDSCPGKCTMKFNFGDYDKTTDEEDEDDEDDDETTVEGKINYMIDKYGYKSEDQPGYVMNSGIKQEVCTKPYYVYTLTNKTTNKTIRSGFSYDAGCGDYNQEEASCSYYQYACHAGYYYIPVEFSVENKLSCEKVDGGWSDITIEFAPHYANGCYVELNFSNYTQIKKGTTYTSSSESNFNCTTETEVTNQLTACDQDSPTYNPQTGTCNKQPFDKLVFRPIDLSNPFPGYDGTGRVSGSNWTTEDIDEYITNRQDVYTKEPLYTVTLTPTKIKEIRKYNKDHDYDDFELECKDNNSRACYSSFIRDYLDEDKSRCFNKTNQDSPTFYTCAIYQ